MNIPQLIVSSRSGSKEKRPPPVWETMDDSEAQREFFRRPRDTLLALAADFLTRAAPRLKEIGKLGAVGEHAKIPDLLDHRCHVVSRIRVEV